MLGRYVAKFFQQYHEVIELNRNVIDAAIISTENLELKLSIWGLAKDDVIINCMGTIKPQVATHGELHTIIVNSVFPRILANIAEKHGAQLIHPTTDCVFSGKRGLYTEMDEFDANDLYGISKAMGEPPNATCIRTSIIGEEVGQARSLVEWIKSSEHQTVNGYINHHWNGMTCLQFAKCCRFIIDANLYWNGVRHLSSNITDKMKLVEMISDIYGLNVTVNPYGSTGCDRTLATIYPLNEKIYIPSLFEQIMEMKRFSNILYS